MSRSPISGSPRPRRPRTAAPDRPVAHPSEPVTGAHPIIRHAAEISETERAFFIEEFRGVTIVIALATLDDHALAGLARVVRAFATGDTRFAFVVSSVADAERLSATVGIGFPLFASEPVGVAEIADLWLAATDHHGLIVAADDVAGAASRVAVNLGAAKLVLTTPEGGWGEPPRSFADLRRHRTSLTRALEARGDAELLPAAEHALAGGAASVNLCRPEDVEFELLTFDGAGTLLTLGNYLSITELRVDDLPAVADLVSRGVASGILKPRTPRQIARMAVGGLGARVTRTGHLAGLVGLETDVYGEAGLGEVSALITVSEFSGAGAGGMLIDELLRLAVRRNLRAVFAVTVSDDAGDFFARRGFVEVPRDAVPAGKWDGYDPDRLARARCFWRDIEA